MTVVRGSHKKQGSGTCVKDYGNVMATTAVDGDSQPTRNIWKTSIKPSSDNVDQKQQDNVPKADVTLTRQQHSEITKATEEVALKLDMLKLKLERLDK